MSASASKRMPDLGYKAVTATLVRPAAYQHGWTNGTMTDIQAVTASSIHLCIYSLTMYVNEGRTEYWHGAIIIPWKNVVRTPFCITVYVFPRGFSCDVSNTHRDAIYSQASLPKKMWDLAVEVMDIFENAKLKG